MSDVRGIDVLIKINTGTDELPKMEKVGGQRGATLNRSADTLESTSKDSEGFKAFEYSFKEWGVDADGLLVDGDEAFEALEDAYMNDKKVEIQMALPSGTVYSGLALLTDFPIEAPYDDLATYSVSFTGAGKLNKK